MRKRGKHGKRFALAGGICGQGVGARWQGGAGCAGRGCAGRGCVVAGGAARSLFSSVYVDSEVWSRGPDVGDEKRPNVGDGRRRW